MIKSIFSFLLGLVVLLVVVLPMNYFLLIELLKEGFGPVYYFTFSYFTFVVIVIQWAMIRALRKRPQTFVWAFLGALGLKMFLTLMILLILMYSGIADSNVFAINFICLYFIFSAFSIIQILKAQRSSVDKEKE